MIRFLFRALATLALAVAVAMAVLDATRSILASAPVLTPLRQSWEAFAPASLASLQAGLEGGLSLLWNPVATTILAAPGFVVFAILALLFYAVGRRPERRLGRFSAQA